MGWRFYPDEAMNYELAGSTPEVMVQVKFVAIVFVLIEDDALARIIDHFRHFFAAYQPTTRYDEMPVLSNIPHVSIINDYQLFFRSSHYQYIFVFLTLLQLEHLQRLFEAPSDAKYTFDQLYDTYILLIVTNSRKSRIHDTYLVSG